MIRTLAAAAVALTLALGTADAQAKGETKAHAKGHPKAGAAKGHAKGEVKSGTKVRTNSGGNVHVEGTFRGAKTPPGLEKKGGLPPGQAKKYRTDDGVTVLRDVFGRHGYTVVRTQPSGDTRYVYYRMKNGTVRRAVVRPGERLAFSNVPAAVLQQVMARLY